MTQPTTGYSADEVSQAVSQLIQASVQYGNDTLGPPTAGVTFGEIQNAAVGVFLLYPKAPFYCLYLGSQRLLQTVQAEALILASLVAAVQAVGRNVLPITDLTPLANAASALQALGSAAGNRTSAFQSLSNVPAYQRFVQNTQSFLGTSGQAVKSGGQIVMTPLEAQTQIPGLVGQLKAAHQALLLSVQGLAQGADDYAQVNLPSAVSQLVLANSTAVLQGHLATLSGQQPGDRLASIRQVVLDVLAAQAVVQQFGAAQAPTDIYPVAGVGNPYSDDQHPGLPAVAVGSIPGPYNTQSPGQYLDVYLDGAGGTPRSLAGFTSVAPVANTLTAQFFAAVPPDVAAGDYIFVLTGSNAGTRWVVQQILGSYVVASGAAPASPDGVVTVEILPPPSVELVLPFATSAQIRGVVVEQLFATGVGYMIGDGTHPVRPTGGAPTPNNHTLGLTIGGLSVTLPLTLSGDGSSSVEATPRTAQQICDDLNAGLGGSNFTAAPYFPLVKFQGSVLEVAVTSTSATFALVGGFGNFGSMNIAVGDALDVLPLAGNGDPSQQDLWTLTAVTATTLTATRVGPGTSLTQAAPVQIQVGSQFRAIRLYANNPGPVVLGRIPLGIVNDGGVESACGTTLGLAPGATARSRPQTAQDLSASISKSTTLLQGLPVFTPALTVNAHATPGNGFLLTLSRAQQTVATTVTGGTTLTAPFLGALVGDSLVERSGSTVGVVWSVTATTSLGLTATLLLGMPLAQPSVLLEAGPGVVLPPYTLVRIPSGPCHGDYYVDSQNYLDLTLVSALPQPTDPTTGQPLSFVVQAGPEALALVSANPSTASKIKIRGPAVPLFFASVDLAATAGVFGTTLYVQIPQVPAGLAAGDLLQLFAAQYNLPSQTQTLTRVEGNLLTLDGPIASGVPWTFGPNAQVPFARLHTGHVADFNEFKAELLAWAALPPQQPLFFTNLSALINPLVANTTPSARDVHAAVQALGLLVGQLTQAGATTYAQNPAASLEALLAGYLVPAQAPVDTLVRTYLAKGADRAIDLLLSGAFDVFFNLTPENTSYAGAMAGAARAVALNDLPVQKNNRTNTQTSRLQASTLSPDPEYDLSDSTGLVPDPLGPEDLANGS